MIKERNVSPQTLNELGLQRCARFVFDASGNTGNRTVATHVLDGESLPLNAVITRVFYDVPTTFTSAADTATIALSIQGAGDVVSAIAIGDGTNPWDAGVHISVVIETAATMVKLTAIRQPTAAVAVQALTAGKLVLYVEYFLSE